MTEDKAKLKMCPSGSESLRGHCIGSRCMAWRETDNETYAYPADHVGPYNSKPAGYCGLAGKP